MISIRTSIGLVLICFAFFAPHVSAQQPRGTTYAFLVGCSGYNRSELKTLPYTINDVSGFADSLLATGVASENIKLLHDKRTDNSGRFLPEKDKILKELKLLIASIDRQDTLIVALSGHGVHFVGDKIGYFCPRDARLSDRKSLLPMEGDGGLYTILKDCPATRKLLLVNACRNDPASDVAQAAKMVNLDDLDTDNVPEGIVALYSCRQGQESYYDPDRKLGIFFDHVNQAWLGKYQTTAEPLTLDMFFEQVKSRTKADADRLYEKPQIPIPKREFSGEWIVNRPSNAKSKNLISRTTGMELLLIPSGTFRVQFRRRGSAIERLRMVGRLCRRWERETGTICP